MFTKYQIPFSSRQVNTVFVYTLFACCTFSIAGSDLSILGLYLVFLWRVFQVPDFRTIPHSVFYGFFLYYFFSIVSGWLTPYSFGVLPAVRDNLRFFLPLVLYFSFRSLNDQKLAHFFLFFLILISLYGMVQFFTGADWFRPIEQQSPTRYKHPDFTKGYTNYFHAKGNFTHHLTYGGMLLLCFPLFVALGFCKSLSIATRRYFHVGVIVILIAIVAALARSIWLGSLAAVSFFFLALPKKWLLLLIALGVIGLGGMFWQYTLKDPNLEMKTSGTALIWQRVESAFILKYNQDRLLLWESARQAFLDRPWFGIGLKNDKEAMTPYREAIISQTGHRFYNSAGSGVHNIYLQILVNLGIFGFISYLSIWILFFGGIWRSLKQGQFVSPYYQSVVWGGSAGIFGFLVAGMFENNFFDAEVQIVLFVIMGYTLYASHQKG